MSVTLKYFSRKSNKFTYLTGMGVIICFSPHGHGIFLKSAKPAWPEKAFHLHMVMYIILFQTNLKDLYYINPVTPVIIGSGYAQLYGTQIINNGISDLLIGLNPKEFQSRVDDGFTVNWTKEAVYSRYKNVQPRQRIA